MFLSEETPVVVEDQDGARPLLRSDVGGAVEWRTLQLSVIPRLGLVLAPNARVVFEPTRVETHDVGFLTFGPSRQEFTAGNLHVRVRFRPTDPPVPGNSAAAETELFSQVVPGFDPREPWFECRYELRPVVGATGSFVVECSGAEDHPTGAGGLALYEFVIGDGKSLDLNRAQSFRELRVRNEKANFDAYYQHSVFQPAADVSASAAGDALEGQNGAAPTSPGTALSYSRKLLSEKLAYEPRPFRRRLQEKLETLHSRVGSGHDPRFHVLSLCSGAARIEAAMVRDLPTERLKMTLVEMNPNLLNTAKRRVSEWCDVEGILADVNSLDLQGQKFDVVLCVSGLHHIVELEHVFGEIARGLKDAGEFWSIGENIGRNGGRMWPEAYDVASAFFMRLDAKYRVNHMTGMTTDEYLPDMDYSIDCFEGIRCEAIEPALLERLSPIKVSKRDCIIGKLFSLSYSDNYDMRSQFDRALVEEAVGLDLELLRTGGRPTELNGMYGKRR